MGCVFFFAPFSGLQFVLLWAVRIITSSCVTCFQSLGINDHEFLKDLAIH